MWQINIIYGHVECFYSPIQCKNSHIQPYITLTVEFYVFVQHRPYWCDMLQSCPVLWRIKKRRINSVLTICQDDKNQAVTTSNYQQNTAVNWKQQSYTNLFSIQWRWSVCYLIFQIFYCISHANWKRSTLVKEAVHPKHIQMYTWTHTQSHTTYMYIRHTYMYLKMWTNEEITAAVNEKLLFAQWEELTKDVWDTAIARQGTGGPRLPRSQTFYAVCRKEAGRCFVSVSS